MNSTLLIVAAYLLGSIPTGLLLGKMFGIDVRKAGSGNIGATNVYRTAGKKLGIITLLADSLKGAVPVVAARYLDMDAAVVAAAGLAAFLGHVFPFYLRFKGGKGVATALGVFLAAAPAAVGIALLAFLGVVLKTRYVSLGSIVAAALVPPLVGAFAAPPAVVVMAVIVSAVVIWRHRENIQRLYAGTENKFK